VIFKHAPAASNPNPPLTHEAALAAGAQGKFWQMHGLLFATHAMQSAKGALHLLPPLW
jgi:hypothetical protein